MRKNIVSSGYEYGRVDGPQVDIFPTAISEFGHLNDEIDLSAIITRMTWDFAKNYQNLFPGWDGIIGYSDDWAVRLVYDPKKYSPVTALAEIERQGEVLPVNIVMAFLIAHTGLRHKHKPDEISANVLMGNYALDLLERIGIFPRDNGEIPGREDVEKIAKAIFTSFTPLKKLRSLGFARVLLKAGEIAWQPPNRTMVGKKQAQEQVVFGALAGLQAFRLKMVQVGQQSYLLDFLNGFQTYLSLVACEPFPEEFLQEVFADGLLSAGVLEMDDDPAFLSSVALSLREAAQRNLRYVPHGAYLLHLPAQLKQRWMRIKDPVRVYADTNKLWMGVTLEDSNSPILCLWKTGLWKTERIIAPAHLSDEAVAALDVLGAAIWHDLVVGGIEKEVGQRESRPHSSDSASSGSASSSRSSSASFLYLPRSCGHNVPELAWGSDDEIRQIRRAHGVRGHLRFLPPGWMRSKDAELYAQEVGIVIPTGYTFVRPHTRGGQRGEIPATPVVSKGLATLLLLVA